ncbi:ATP-binding protein [Mangrovimonas aestuarii]|uniref:ATP-binding protein n=1 Tax=Mangrovimonas aestuarii TaxID=3018443 RepID=UPI002378229C|nr:ATP-binding protein [Mangrovimonas aestuarii]
MEEKLKQNPSNCIKIVLFGPESTGKSTLAKQLADHYNTIWVPEYSRLYAEERHKQGQKLSAKDVMPIAYGQMKLENDLVHKVDKLLVCDTDLLETKVYAKSYYPDNQYKWLDKYAKENTYHLYFLTYIDLPWEEDGIRDKPHQREKMFQAFQKALKDYQKPHVLLKGNQAQRLDLAIKHIDELLTEHQ